MIEIQTTFITVMILICDFVNADLANLNKI